jgi:hypothetical protein
MKIIMQQSSWQNPVLLIVLMMKMKYIQMILFHVLTVVIDVGPHQGSAAYKDFLYRKEFLMNFYEKLQKKALLIIEEYDLGKLEVNIQVRTLAPIEAIGETTRQDYPLLIGKEVMIEADFLGAKGQAFTTNPQDFKGFVYQIMTLPLNNTANRAVFIATLNAIMCYLGKAEKTIHCQNDEPEKCGEDMAQYIMEKYGSVKIGLIGLQPAILDALQKNFEIRVLDLNPETIGTIKSNILIEDGNEQLNSVKEWAQLLLVTGSTIVNGSIIDYLNLNIPVLLYGNTIAAAAKLMNLERVCFYAG